MDTTEKVWVSFCMSTYNRPDFLKSQITSLLLQTFPGYEIVICDNDPTAAVKPIIDSFNDARIKYHCNHENIGMIKSFNRSIELANGQYIVMITDDDPVAHDFIETFHAVIHKFPGYSVYGGLKRNHTKEGGLEIINQRSFISEFLDPQKTTEILWSSCLLRREDVLAIGKLPDYGVPHLTDHALIAMVGSMNGGVIINRMYSNIVSHAGNFSKLNFDHYYTSCIEFYNLLNSFIANKPLEAENRKAVTKHLGKWFISYVFGLLNHYKTAANYNRQKLNEVKTIADKVLELPYMKKYRFKYEAKLFILNTKFAMRIKK